jgi:hypothetical protein
LRGVEWLAGAKVKAMTTRKTDDHEWAAKAVRALIRRLMQHLASEHEKAAAELRKASR